MSVTIFRKKTISEGATPLQREAKPLFPLLRGRGLFINLTPLVPLSFEGEGAPPLFSSLAKGR